MDIKLKDTSAVKDSEKEYRVELYLYEKNSHQSWKGLRDSPLNEREYQAPVFKVFTTWENYKNEILRQYPDIGYIKLLSERSIADIIKGIESTEPTTQRRTAPPLKGTSFIDITDTMFCVKNSPVDGDGLFSKSPIEEGVSLFSLDGDIVDMKEKEEAYPSGEWNAISQDGIFLVRKNRTIYGYINHSRTPNVEINFEDYSVRTLCKIKEGDELFLDYRKEVLPDEYLDGFGKTYL